MTLQEYKEKRRKLLHQHNYHVIDMDELVREIEIALLSVPRRELIRSGQPGWEDAILGSDSSENQLPPSMTTCPAVGNSCCHCGQCDEENKDA